MENKEKLQVLLQHWIDHNIGHAEEFDKWRHSAEHDGESAIAAAIGQAITEMEKVNTSLAKALKEAGGTPAGGGHRHHDHHHDHHHHHSHDHGHHHHGHDDHDH